MRRFIERSLLVFAVWSLLTQGAALAANASPFSIAAAGDSGNSAALSANVGHSIVDDLIAANDQREQRGFAERSTSARRETSTDESPTELPVLVPQADESNSWILGAFAAVFALGIGIAVAGIYWSGPRALARL